MSQRKRRVLLKTTAMLVSTCVLLPITAQAAGDNWQAVDALVKTQVFQVNVAMRAQLASGLFAQLADLSPRMKYPVFTTTPEDKGFRVVGYGSCFPIRTARADRIYFLTNKHVLDFGDGMIEECQRFFAAMRLHAKLTAGFSDPETRFLDLMRVVNMRMNPNLSDAERQMYKATVDAIWDTYDNHLSLKADPGRNEFQKWVKATGLQGTAAFFLHPAGAANIPALQPSIYKVAQGRLQPDLALLSCPPVKGITPLELDSSKQSEGQPIQAVGYPTNARPDAAVSFYAPTFSNGRITSVKPGWIEFDAPVSKGDSGGPLINARGKAIGVVVRRARQNEARTGNSAPLSNKYATAIDVATVRAFVPELFR